MPWAVAAWRFSIYYVDFPLFAYRSLKAKCETIWGTEEALILALLILTGYRWWTRNYPEVSLRLEWKLWIRVSVKNYCRLR
jgi:hypothetical protein